LSENDQALSVPNRAPIASEGDVDLRGFLGLSDDVKVGYQNIRVYFKIDADITEAQKEELVKMAQKYSPVFNTVFNRTPVSVQLDH